MAAVEIAPGAFHRSHWLNPTEQAALVRDCRQWSLPPAGMRATRMRNGSMMSVQSVCLGWHWVPYRYQRTADDGFAVKPFPQSLSDLGRRALAECGIDELYDPDVAMINFYDEQAKMGMHQDKDELSSAPVVSISLGNSCLFRLGNTETRTKPWTEVLLESGDLFVFGGPARMAFHSVPKTLPGTAPEAIGIDAGRLNITLRESGRADN